MGQIAPGESKASVALLKAAIEANNDYLSNETPENLLKANIAQEKVWVAEKKAILLESGQFSEAIAKYLRQAIDACDTYLRLPTEENLEQVDKHWQLVEDAENIALRKADVEAGQLSQINVERQLLFVRAANDFLENPTEKNRAKTEFLWKKIENIHPYYSELDSIQERLDVGAKILISTIGKIVSLLVKIRSLIVPQHKNSSDNLSKIKMPEPGRYRHMKENTHGRYEHPQKPDDSET
jgi:hypothetical protein